MTRRVLLALAFAAIGVAIFAARPRPTPGPLARDFEAYWAAGSAWNEHADPYGRAIWDAERSVPGVDARREEILPFVNPPATLPLWSLLARLPYDAGARLWLAILGAALLALVVTVLAGSANSIAPLSFAAAVALAIACGPITSDLALGQFALAAFLGATLVAVMAPRSRLVGTAAACIAFAQPNVALGLITQLGRKGVALAIASGAVLTYLVGAIYAGYSWPVSYLRELSAHEAAERFAAIQLAPVSTLHGLGLTPVSGTLADAGLFFLAAVATLAIMRRTSDYFARFSACSALSPFLAGFFHEHDLVVAYAAIVWCGLRTTGAARTIALAGTLLVCVDWLGLAQRPTGFAQSALLAGAAFCSFLALGSKVDRRSALGVALGSVSVFAAAAWLGTHHPAPVWPDALGAFHARPSASIAEVWSAEQRSNGLDAVVPAWALLRGLSLLGCGLLAFAIYRHPSYCRTA